MNILGFDIRRRASEKYQDNAPPNLIPVGRTGGTGGSLGWSGFWWPVIRESFTGAWQQNVVLRPDTVLSYFAVFACVSLIAGDIAKLTLRLVVQDKDGIWEETSSPSFSPVLRKPNRYQTVAKFVEQWISSKLVWGNTFVLKERDNRGVVVGLYILHPQRVRVLVAPDGSVYYELDRDPLSQLLNVDRVIVPASEIIHDTMICLFHPLIGVSPIYACGLAAVQGLKMQGNSTQFFANGAQPGGVLTAPGAISKTQAQRLADDFKTNFSGENAGSVAVMSDGLKYQQLTMNAVDAELIDQLKWTADAVCSCYHVPPYMIGAGPPPPYANAEPLLQAYYAQCLQSLITNLERSLDEGLGIDETINGQQYGTEFDIDDLIWMDTKTRSDAAAKSAGTLSPNEARRKYYGMGPSTGGDSPMVQQQYFSLDALAKRDAADPFAKPAPPVTPAPAAASTVTPPPTRAATPDLDIAELRRRVDRRVRERYVA
jgi:HK97 family phage portal protein